jgi:hypothetical protein
MDSFLNIVFFLFYSICLISLSHRSILGMYPFFSVLRFVAFHSIFLFFSTFCFSVALPTNRPVCLAIFKRSQSASLSLFFLSNYYLTLYCIHFKCWFLRVTGSHIPPPAFSLQLLLFYILFISFRKLHFGAYQIVLPLLCSF